MRRFRRSLAPLLALVLAAQIAAAAPRKKAARRPLPAKIVEILSQADVARGFWGIEIVSLKTGRTLYSQNPTKLFTPASNTKLFTVSAAFALIGPDYRFRTTVETTGTLDRYGRLSGDLVLVGRGDPNLSGRTLPYNLRTERKMPPVRVLEDLADQLVRRGVRFIDGDIVGDDSYYAFERYGEGWAQDDMVWEWGAPVSALTVNDNVIFVTILPAEHAGQKAFVNITPFADYYKLDNRVMTTPAGTGPRRVYITREPGSNSLTLWGTMPVDDVGASESLAIEDPADFAAKLFRELLGQRGIVVYGSARTRHTELANLQTFTVTATAPAGGGSDVRPRPQTPPATLLATYDSQPVAYSLRVVNKVSQNLHAELILRLLGREKGTAGTIEAGLEVMRGFLTQADIRSDEYVFFDGSGLSRQNLVTPNTVIKLLKYVSTQPWADLFKDSLPVAGLDGSLAERFKGSPAQGRVRAKTGSLGHVNSLAGYATTVKGEEVVFSIMTNNHNLTNKRALETIDEIVNAVVDDR